MRTSLSSVVLAVFAAASLAEEAPTPVDDGKTGTTGFKFEIGTKGGVLRDWIQNDLKTFNLAIATGSSAMSTLGVTVFESLFTQDRVTLAWKPELASAVPTRSEDDEGRTYVIKLREGVTWHDGKPFCADDVVFTVNEVILNETIPSPSRALLSSEVTGADGKKTRVSASVEKVDDLTVRFVLAKRHPLFLSLMNIRVLPRHVLKPFVDAGSFAGAWGTETPPGEIVGTGPFRISGYRKGEGLTLARYDGYWKRDEAGNRLPYLDGIEFRLIPDPDTLTAEFLAGRLDYLEMQPAHVESVLKRTDRKDIEVVSAGSRAGWSYLAFNQNPRSSPDGTPYVEKHKSAWFRDVRFRRAFAHTIDRARILADVYAGRATSLKGPYIPRFPRYFLDDVREYPLDYKAAGALLDDMGLKDTDGDGVREDAAGHPLSFTLLSIGGVESSEIMTNIIVESAAKAGIRVTLERVPFNELVAQINTPDWEAVVLGFTAGPEPLLGKVIWKSGEARRMWNPSSPAGSPDERPWEKRLDEIFEEAYTAWDPVKREFDGARDVALAHEWQRICAENLPHIYLFCGRQYYFFASRVRNRCSTPHSIYDIERIFLRE